MRGAPHRITDDYVPLGTRSFHVQTTAGLAVGDAVIVERPTTQKWIHALGMDRIPPRADGHPTRQWKPGAGLFFDRRITALGKHRVTVDAPLTNAIESRYTTGTVWAYSFVRRARNVGVENLAADGSLFARDPSFPNHSTTPTLLMSSLRKTLGFAG